MSLKWKLLMSYLVVIIVGASVLAVSTATIAPQTFSTHMQTMRENMSHRMQNSAMDDFFALENELNSNFQLAVNSTLLLATLASAFTAGIVSIYVSQRIVSMIRQTVQASRRIAAGHYDERLIVHSEDELGQLAQSFNAMATSLANTETLRQQLIADVSHELKTPLAGIQAYMEGLEDGVIPLSPETFTQIRHEVLRLQRLVSDLQELSKAEAQQLSINIQPCNIRQIAEASVELLSPQFDNKGVELKFETSEIASMISADCDRLRQVILNLINNALQYTPSGGCVTVGWNTSEDHIKFFVQDTGVGLSDTDIEHIFQRFYRVDKSRARVSGGNGIGLTISRHILRAHGSELHVHSQGTGKGSTFYFELPRHTIPQLHESVT